MEIIVTGTLSYDYIMQFSGSFQDRILTDKIEKISLSFLVDKLTKHMGGTAGNITYSLQLLGERPYILAPVGNDFTEYYKFLDKHGIRVAGITLEANEITSSYYVTTDKNHNQIGSFYTGASQYAAKLSIVDFIKLQKLSSETTFVVISPTDPEAMKKYVKECHTAKLKYLYDPAFQIGNFSGKELREGISKAQIFIGNDYEIALVESKLGISHEELITMVPILITTLGDKGSVIETRKESIHIKPAQARKVSDPTGAGDAYRAGFLAGYLSGKDLITSGKMGSISAVYSIEKFGTLTHEYTLKEFTSRYKENYGDTLT